MTRAIALALAVLLALPGGAAAQAPPAKHAKRPSAAQVLAGVEAVYKQPTELTATFEQAVTNAAFGKTSKTTGKLYVQKPNKLRFDYGTPQKLDKAFIFDGKTLWIVEPSNLQVIVHTTQSSTLPAAIAFFTGAGSLARDFKVAFATTKDHQVPGGITLELTPRRASAAYKRLYLVIDPSTNQVGKTIVIDSSDNINMFTFGNVDLKAAVKPSLFTFDPKSVPHYRIVTANTAAKPAPKPATRP